ncbi:MAG: lytic transglycosylase [Peptococcaceae bacterium BICA1-7]|nr:MAG: lytic transglycosylase [Peptococcaceae bacterium BICA1-7]HBV95895.1 lytic transglycosylase domain-containing protein [Desulfotomaculum sp.]
MIINHKRRKFKVTRLLIVALLILLFLNADNIGRMVFPVPYRQIIFSQAAGTGLDPYLLAAMVKTESNFNPGAVSIKGARGLMQVMPETGRWVAGQKGVNNYSHDLLFIPEKNIQIGAYYVGHLLENYKGNTVMMLGAYNAGTGNVKKWVEQGQWNGEKSRVDRIPYPETRQFIRKVLFYQQVYSYLYRDQPITDK